MQKFEKANFNIANYDETDNYGKFVIEPLERGFGTTSVSYTHLGYDRSNCRYVNKNP